MPSTHKTSKLHEKTLSIGRGKSNSGSLSSFCVLPKDVQFDVQHAEEEILLFMRQHFIVNLGWIVLCVFLFFLPSLLPFFPAFKSIPASFGQVAVQAWYLIVAGYALERFVVWYFNVYIVTNERIVDVDFYSLLFKRVSETKLEYVQDITAATGGVAQSIFDFGDVIVQTAAEVPEIEFEHVPHPASVTKLVSELITERKHKKHV